MELFLKPFGAGEATTVEAFEQRNQLVLPDDYKEFLIQSNGGQLDGMACFVKAINDSVLVDVLLGIDQEEQSLSSDFWLDRFRNEMPAGFVVIGLGATGMFILGTKGPNVGVYFWDDAHTFAGSSKEGGNTYKVAETFREFLASLQPVE